MFLCMAADDIIAGSVLVHHIEEHFLDARALLIDGIIKRINQVVHTLYDLIDVEPLGSRFIITYQFGAMIHQVLKLDAFWMSQKKQIYRLVYRLQFHLLIIIYEQKAIQVSVNTSSSARQRNHASLRMSLSSSIMSREKSASLTGARSNYA